jgi:hypothetical protein
MRHDRIAPRVNRPIGDPRRKRLRAVYVVVSFDSPTPNEKLFGGSKLFRFERGRTVMRDDESPHFNFKLTIDARGKDAIAAIRRPFHIFVYALSAALTLFVAYHIPFGSLSRLLTWFAPP